MKLNADIEKLIKEKSEAFAGWDQYSPEMRLTANRKRDELFAIQRAHEDGMRAGFRLGVEKAAEIIEKYAEPWGIEFCDPVKPDDDAATVTRASMQMGRHCVQLFTRELRALASEHPDAGAGDE